MMQGVARSSSNSRKGLLSFLSPRRLLGQAAEEQRERTKGSREKEEEGGRVLQQQEDEGVQEMLNDERCFMVSRKQPTAACPTKTKWFSLRWRGKEEGLWVWWAIGGYLLSCLLFNITDIFNELLLQQLDTDDLLQPQGESVVQHIMNPAINTLSSFLVGALAPCLSAPYWEELLYRGFCLPFLHQLLPLPAALLLSSLLFAAHHMNLHTLLPLFVLGTTWATLYIHSRNLFTTILIHAMWNTRVFLASFAHRDI